MSDFIYETATHIYDPLHAFWEKTTTQRKVASVLITVFLAGVAGIELNRRGLLPPFLAARTPHSHFYAVNLAFNLVLITEVMRLVFVLPCSVSRSLGKQFEILCLIFLGNSFKELVHFHEPITVTGEMAPLLTIVSYGVGAMVVFACLGFYYRLQLHKEMVKGGEDKFRFVAAKKLLALLLLAVYLGMGVHWLWILVHGGNPFMFFATFYTVLVFCDILVVLISFRYAPAFHALFRNSGYAVATLVIRLALSAPPFYDTGLGAAAGLYAVCLTLAYNYFAPHMKEQHGRPGTRPDLC